MGPSYDAEGADLQAEIKKLDAKINRLSDLLSETTAIGKLLQKIEEFANQRASLEDQLSRLEVTRKQSKALHEIKKSDVQSMLSRVAENLPELDRESLKAILRSLIDRITLDSSSPACCIHYKIKLNLGELVASPGGFEPPYSP